MTWALDLVPSKWNESLVFPLKHSEPSTFMVSNDPADLGDLLDDVLYLVQSTPHTVDMLTEKPAVLGAWMFLGGRPRLELLRRQSSVRWGIVLGDCEGDAGIKMHTMLQWPVRSRWVIAPKSLNLSAWEPHAFSTAGHSGKCEDCGRGRGESVLHLPTACPQFRRVDG